MKEPPKSIKSLPRRQRKAAEQIIASFPPEDRKAWDEMAAEDEGLLIMVLGAELACSGGVFDREGIRKHFRLSRILLGLTPNDPPSS
jgi:hypothetical protein